MTGMISARTAVRSLVGVLIASVVVSACSSSPAPSSSSRVAAGAATSTARTAPAKAGSTATSGSATSTKATGTKSGSGSGHTRPGGAHGTWDKHYQTLASSHTVPRGSALKFEHLQYDVMSGGWNIDAAFKYTGHLRGPLLYFALQTGKARPTPATEFRLTTTRHLQVFVIAPQSPRPTDVIIYQSKANGDQGARLLSVRIPDSAITAG
jgi:hypothetical protein